MKIILPDKTSKLPQSFCNDPKSSRKKAFGQANLGDASFHFGLQKTSYLEHSIGIKYSKQDLVLASWLFSFIECLLLKL